MRTLIITLIAFVILITSFLFIMDYLSHSISDLIAIDHQVITYITEENWEAAKETFEAFMQVWEKHESVLHIFLNQESVTAVTHAMHQAKVFILYKEASDALSHLSLIEEQLNFLNDNEKLTWQNIF